jgi:hypothetical protein
MHDKIRIIFLIWKIFQLLYSYLVAGLTFIKPQRRRDAEVKSLFLLKETFVKSGFE